MRWGGEKRKRLKIRIEREEVRVYFIVGE